MLKSMTGYGRAALSELGCEFTLELRAVNHRYLDINVRVPRVMSFVEDTIKSVIIKRLSRGKIDVYLTVDTKAADIVKISLNKSVARSYYNALLEMKDELGLSGEPRIDMLARMPDVFATEREQPDAEAVAEAVGSLTGAALDELESMRAREGARLCASIFDGIAVIEELTVRIEERTPMVISEYRTKLETRLREFLENITVDEMRLLTEVAIFADKVANNEELVRLRSHLTELGTLLKKSGAQGRKIDFLIQELNREVNTIGSKGNDAELSRIVVDLKSEIEKIREQIQNLE
jgi:uncharacterized protein (TIGR00255 family)